MRLTNKVAIVTGASRGIGAEIAKQFAREGSKVVINYHRNEDKAQEIVEEIKSWNGDAIAMQGDVTSTKDMSRLVKTAIERFSGIDIFVNNAGWAKLQELSEIVPDDIDRQLTINIKGLILGTQAAARFMRKNGRIINITSIAAKGGVGSSVYSATKAAGNTLTKCYAAELGSLGITVNAIAPAAVETDLYYEVGLDKNHGNSLAATPLGWIGTVKDIAKAAVFFASEDAAWITGEVLQVSGGKAMS